MTDPGKGKTRGRRKLDRLHATNDAAQFVIATHSPLLVGFRGARILSFDRIPVTEYSV